MSIPTIIIFGLISFYFIKHKSYFLLLLLGCFLGIYLAFPSDFAHNQNPSQTQEIIKNIGIALFLTCFLGILVLLGKRIKQNVS